MTTSPNTAGDNDFSAKTVDVTFQPGETGPKPIPINIIDDDVVESKEEFTVTISSPSPGVTVGEPATVIIKDNDKAGKLFGVCNEQQIHVQRSFLQNLKYRHRISRNVWHLCHVWYYIMICVAHWFSTM